MKLPFAFARRHGVLIESLSDSVATVLALPTASAASLLEVRRVTGVPLRVREAPAHEFNAHLQATYEAVGSNSDQM
ncbi:MAG: hypothetical protein ACREXT_17720, partial [Gammaproteobacteria bacterium]